MTDCQVYQQNKQQNNKLNFSQGKFSFIYFSSFCFAVLLAVKKAHPLYLLHLFFDDGDILVIVAIMSCQTNFFVFVSEKIQTLKQKTRQCYRKKHLFHFDWYPTSRWVTW